MRLRRQVPERVIRLSTAGLPAGLSAQQLLRDLGGPVPAVPDDQAPAPDMPALSLMVLGALADDAETIDTMRNCGDRAPYGLATIGECHIRRTLRALLDDGLIEVEEETIAIDDDHLAVRSPGGPPPTGDADLRRYWYVMTPAGQEVWHAGHCARDADGDAHPSGPRR